MIALFVATAWAAECATATDVAAFEARMTEAEAAFAALDDARFGKVMDETAALVPCVSGAISTADAARYHRLQGLRQFAARQDERAALAFAAARHASPGESLPAALAPPGHVLRTLYVQVPLDSAAFETVAAPRKGELHFDGTATNERPRTWPTLVQVLDGEQHVAATAYLLPTDPMPTYAAKTLPKAALLKNPVAVPLLAGAAGSAVVSAVMYGLAAQSAADVAAPPSDWGVAEHDAAQTRANGFAVASGATALIAVGAGAVLVGVVW